MRVNAWTGDRAIQLVILYIRPDGIPESWPRPAHHHDLTTTAAGRLHPMASLSSQPSQCRCFSIYAFQESYSASPMNVSACQNFPETAPIWPMSPCPGPRAHAASPGVVEQYLERLGLRRCDETTRNRNPTPPRLAEGSLVRRKEMYLGSNPSRGARAGNRRHGPSRVSGVTP